MALKSKQFGTVGERDIEAGAMSEGCQMGGLESEREAADGEFAPVNVPTRAGETVVRPAN